MVLAAFFMLLKRKDKQWYLCLIQPHDNQLTFHLPLHRYLAAFLMLGVQSQGISLDSVLPSQDRLCQIMMHPLQVQVGTGVLRVRCACTWEPF